MPIMIDEQSGVLLGEHRSDLAGECHTLIHAFAPLRYKSSKTIPAQDREILIEQLKDNFILDTTRPSVKRFLNYLMSKGYTNFKREMLMHFREYATIEEGRGNPFGNISPANWSSLCELFVLERIKKCRDCHENFKAVRPYIVRLKGEQSLQGHTLPVSQDEKKSIYTERRWKKLMKPTQVLGTTHSVKYCILEVFFKIVQLAAMSAIAA
ncbi:uncharacterized protein LOC113322240 [Papaver somniferum]|uniref:uncharacterized protein LOC113322240 n=1 Tax=Papaver somniferum TaxID=3469 RepID=UPI000E6FBFBA|nr:uncharacterized protein LOC113322240 [Papaver somniferum]